MTKIISSIVSAPVAPVAPPASAETTSSPGHPVALGGDQLVAPHLISSFLGTLPAGDGRQVNLRLEHLAPTIRV
ncbi:MAG: hypothetical protein V4623_01535 [Pseudomonadota bacterium]